MFSQIKKNILALTGTSFLYALLLTSAPAAADEFGLGVGVGGDGFGISVGNDGYYDYYPNNNYYYNDPNYNSGYYIQPYSNYYPNAHYQYYNNDYQTNWQRHHNR